MSIPNNNPIPDSVFNKIQLFQTLPQNSAEPKKEAAVPPEISNVVQGVVQRNKPLFEKQQSQAEYPENLRRAKFPFKAKGKQPASEPAVAAQADESPESREIRIVFATPLSNIDFETRTVMIPRPLSSPERQSRAPIGPEYPTIGRIKKEPILKEEPTLLEEINTILDEKDEKGFKRRGAYYIALDTNDPQKPRLVWKPRAESPKKKEEEPKEIILRKEEQKEVVDALNFVLEALNASYDKGVTEVKSRISEQHDPLDIILDKIIERKWCKPILRDKKQKTVRRGVIRFLYRNAYAQPVHEAKRIKYFIDKSMPLVNRLTTILSSLQVTTVSKVAPEMVERGLPLVKPVDLSEDHKRITKKVIDARSPRIQEIYKEQKEKRTRNYMAHKACQEGFKGLPKKEKERVVKDLGIGSGYDQFQSEAESTQYLMKVFAKPDVLTGCYDENNITTLTESLHKCENSIKGYVDYHQKWADSEKKLRRFIKSELTSEKRKARAKEAYKEGNWGECLRRVFHYGCPNLEFAALLRDIFKRSLLRLGTGEKGISAEARAGFEKRYKDLMQFPTNWDGIEALFKEIEQEFERLKLG